LRRKATTPQCRRRKKETDPQRVHHRQAGSGGPMNPRGRREIDRARDCIDGAPLLRVQRVEVSLQTEFSGTARQTNSFQRGLEDVAIQKLVVVSLCAQRVAVVGASTEARRIICWLVPSDTKGSGGGGSGSSSRTRWRSLRESSIEGIVRRNTTAGATVLGEMMAELTPVLHGIAAVIGRLFEFARLVLVNNRQRIEMVAHHRTKQCCRFFGLALDIDRAPARSTY